MNSCCLVLRGDSDFRRTSASYDWSNFMQCLPISQESREVVVTKSRTTLQSSSVCGSLRYFRLCILPMTTGNSLLVNNKLMNGQTILEHRVFQPKSICFTEKKQGLRRYSLPYCATRQMIQFFVPFFTARIRNNSTISIPYRTDDPLTIPYRASDRFLIRHRIKLIWTNERVVTVLYIHI